MAKYQSSEIYTILLSLLIGFKSVHLTDSTECMETEHVKKETARGYISSPNYPMHSNAQVCKTWYITGSADEIITISFEDYDLPSYPGRPLVLGSSPQVVVNGTMSRTPLVYTSKKHMMWIQYNYTSTKPGRGFRLSYIKGPAYSGSCLSDEFLCVSSGHCILEKWRCNGAPECPDASDEYGCEHHPIAVTPPSGYSCGNDAFGCVGLSDNQYRCYPNSYMCDGTKHCADDIDESKCASANCYQTLSGVYGNFTSPNYPHFYSENAHCQYLIRVGHGHQIQVRFPFFQLDRGDTLSIYNGGSDEYPMLGSEYDYHNAPPQVLTSSNDTVFVEFRSNDDGRVARGFNITYQVKGYCFNGQFRCEYGETDCYEHEQHCDGKWDCPLNGGDERGCRSCADHLFSCATSNHCYELTEHCNGLRYCPDKSDEENCTPARCGPQNGTFLCDNKRCIYESWVCDHADDCKDGSDEKHCSGVPSRKVITAAVLGSLLCALLLVIAIGCTCKLHAYRMNQMMGGYARYMSPTARVEQEIWARQSAPPLYDEAMRTSRPFDEAQREFMQALRQAMEQRTNNQQQQQPPADNQGQTASTSNSEERPQTSAASAGDVPMINLDADPDTTSIDEEASNVLITVTTGIRAQWRRNRHRTGGSSSADESSSSSHAGSENESSKRAGSSEGIASTSIQLRSLNNCDIEQSTSTVSSQRDIDTTLHNMNPNTDNKPDQALVQNESSDGEKPEQDGQFGEGVQLQIINSPKGVDSQCEEMDVESFVEDISHVGGKFSSNSAFIPDSDAGRLRTSFSDHPQDGASVSDVSLVDWPEGDGDASMLSLE